MRHVQLEPLVCEVEHHICDYHKRNPHDRAWPGCTCSSCYSARVKRPDEYTEEDSRNYRDALLHELGLHELGITAPENQ